MKMMRLPVSTKNASMKNGHNEDMLPKLLR